MRDEETGIDPLAADGEPFDAESEIERRRQLKEARERAEEAATSGKAGRAIDDQDVPGEMFPMGAIDGDHKITMKNIAPASVGRKTEAKMGATAIPLRGGLVRYGELVELIVTVEAGKVEEVPDLEEQDSAGQRKLLGVKDVQRFRPVHVASAAGLLTVDQVLDILEREFGVPRTADKVREVFGLAGRAAAG